MSFYASYLLCLALGVACVAAVCWWNSRWRGGFAWDGSALQFNWHPVLMVTGLVVMYGYGERAFNFRPLSVLLLREPKPRSCRRHGDVAPLLIRPPTGAVLYRVPLTWGQNKLPWKLLHAALMLLALVLSVLGLCAVFDFHNANQIQNLYSLHSWVGIGAVALFAVQVLSRGVMFGGFFFCPCP